MRALPFLVILLVVALALWVIQSGHDGSTAPVQPADAPAEDSRDPGSDAARSAGERTADRAAETSDDRDRAAPSGAGLAVVVQVSDAAGAPLAGARATLVLFSDGGDIGQAALGTSGSDGRIERALDLTRGFAAAALHGLEWRVDAWAPGHRASFVAGALAGARRIEVAIGLERGATLRGRVVDASGRPVARAQVSAQATTSAGGLQQPPADAQRTDALGRFTLACRPGKRGALLAYESKHGAGLVHPLDLGRDAHLGDVVLEPLGTLAGRVLHPDGTPARRIAVSATYQPMDLAATEEVQRAQRAEYRRRRLETVQAGRVDDWTSTDDEGRFRFAGLLPGSYFLQLQIPWVWSGLEFDLGHIFETPLAEIELRTEVSRLLVEVQSATGESAPGLGVTCWVLDELGVPTDDALTGSRLETTSGGPPRAAFVVTPGLRYVLAVHGHGAYACEEEVLAVGDAYEQLHVLRLPAADATGELSVDLRGADGRAWNEWRVTLRGRRLGLAVAGWEQRAPDADGVLREVPVGEWLVELTALGTASDEAFLWLPEPRSPVSIARNQRATVVVIGALGARVQVTLDAAELDAWPPLSDDPAVNAKRLQEHGVWVWLQPADESAWLPVFCVDERLSPDPERRTLPGLVAGAVGPFPPGAYTLMISGPTVRQHREPLVLTAGTVTARSIVLHPR